MREHRVFRRAVLERRHERIDVVQPLAGEDAFVEQILVQVGDGRRIRIHARMPGVKACAITFSDGLSLAGELPEEIAAEGLCAMAPAVLERIDQHVRETTLGSLTAVTLYTSGSALSFFAHGKICLTALHAEGSLLPKTRTQIAELVEKLSRTYAQTEKPHVDH